jgi:hypothetical protein
MAFIRTYTTAKPTAPVGMPTGGLAATVGSFPRLTPEAVKRAFWPSDARVHWRPIRGRWTDGMLGCDALSAVVSRRLGKDEPVAITSLKWAAGQLGVPLDYARGFLGGWENFRRPKVDAGVLVALGWTDGRSAAGACGLATGEEDFGECIGR